MSFKGWPVTNISLNNRDIIMAKSPLILSASRATDIPAFYTKWFFNRIRAGFITWKNPFNGKESFISFDKARVIVFWTKNPEPIIPYLKFLDEKNIGYYFLYTLNNYEKENLEPNLPPINDRIETFRRLSNTIGKEKVIWRFDPIIKTPKTGIAELTDRIKFIGDKIHPYTEKLIFSFIQIAPYKKVKNKLTKESAIFNGHRPDDFEFSTKEKEQTAKILSAMTKKWNITLASCAEEIDLERYGIQHNKCIDDKLMRKLFPTDEALINFLNISETDLSSQKRLFNKTTVKNVSLKDKGQRKACGCIYSKDIGRYNTCPHLCTYCYANKSANTAIKNYRNHNPDNPAIN